MDPQKIKPGDTVQCECCGVVFAAENPAWEAEAEYQREFPMEAAAGEERATICGACFESFMRWWRAR